ncbi:hypothetical protein MferCBS49748_005906 [Microsporum ferrugineum]
MALKLINSNNADDARHELETENHITQRNPEHRGHVILRTCLDSFEVAGPEGKHMCLVYEPMREPLWIFQKRFVDPLIIFTQSAKLSTQVSAYRLYTCSRSYKGLTYPPDLKLDNILMCFENDNILTNFIKRKRPMQYKVDDKSGRTIYRCHNDFGSLDVKDIKNMFPRIADFGLAIRLDQQSTRNGVVGEHLGIYPIQPDHYRAPEVILGCGWDSKADIWNFGVLLWNILGSKELFQQVVDANGQYDAKSHLAEMIALLGPPPKALVAKSKVMSERNWPQPVTNEIGKLCNNSQEFFDGPFFNAEGEFCCNDLIPSRVLEGTTPFLEEKERDAFLSFVGEMLTWLPEERKTARELMNHPFLKLRG